MRHHCGTSNDYRNALDGSPGQDIMHFHELLGHLHEELTHTTAEENGIYLTGN